MYRLDSYRKKRSELRKKFRAELLLSPKDIRKDRREYQRFYYQQRKEELSNKRKQKYREDPEYRQKVMEASKAYRDKQKIKMAKLKAAGKIISKRHRGPRKPVVLNINGKAVYAYTLSTLAERVGRSRDTINHWISIGTIPKTPLWSKRGDRLYTDAMILIVKMAVQTRGVVGHNPMMRAEIAAGWSDIGIHPKMEVDKIQEA